MDLPEKKPESIMKPSPANPPDVKPANPVTNEPKKGFFSGFFKKSNPENPEDENKRKEDCEVKCKATCDKPRKPFYFFGGKKYRSKKNKNSKNKTQKSQKKMRKTKSKKSAKSK